MRVYLMFKFAKGGFREFSKTKSMIRYQYHLGLVQVKGRKVIPACVSGWLRPSDVSPLRFHSAMDGADGQCGELPIGGWGSCDAL